MYAAPATIAAIAAYLIMSALIPPELTRITRSFGRTLAGTLIPTSSPAPALSTDSRLICIDSTVISMSVVAPRILMLSPIDRSPVRTIAATLGFLKKDCTRPTSSSDTSFTSSTEKGNRSSTYGFVFSPYIDSRSTFPPDRIRPTLWIPSSATNSGRRIAARTVADEGSTIMSK